MISHARNAVAQQSYRVRQAALGRRERTTKTLTDEEWREVKAIINDIIEERVTRR